ncbi:MAG: toll/interleukin-1 receptor domain-containing protein [Clostridia bacterium]|nr:toll/interleukin-1 receptor domain-containing protein [Clostridia bacterium]
MSIFKCKMCGGTLEIQNNETVATCEYCGTKQTLPRLDDEKRANLYDRANHFRRNNEFDKAAAIYEQILSEDGKDAEAYWSLVLCRYGIEYVEDPATHKRVPTVNRAQFTSIYADADYQAALEHADGYQRTVYEEEAKAIDEIQKGILAISQKEEPFDVFICYKETDNNGRRTPDSVLANDLYHQLTQEGFKVFFARITLEDKLGSAYEPYIFAALNSAKVMVVLGTKPEYFNAVWVKNEWSRFLALTKDGKKTLIPAYKDMDPYYLPPEFANLQAQDMSKLGFMQDLIRGIKKILQRESAEKTVVNPMVEMNDSTEVLLKRTIRFLKVGDWANADEYCEKVLDINPDCADAYIGKLMAELHVHNFEDLAKCTQSLEKKSNYQNAFQCADDSLRQTLVEYASITEENSRKKAILTVFLVVGFVILCVCACMIIPFIS